MVRIQRAICTFQLMIIVKTIVWESMGIIESMHKADINDLKDERVEKSILSTYLSAYKSTK